MSDHASVDRFTDGARPPGVRRSHGLYLRIAVTALILVYIGTRLDWRELSAQIGRARPWWLLAACFMFGVSYFLGAVRWWFLLAVQNIRLPFPVVARLTFVGQFFNAFMLGAIGGDLMRTVLLLKHTPNQRTHATLSVIMDRSVGLLLLLIGCALVLPWQWEALRGSQPSRDVLSTLIFVLVVMIVTLLLVFLMPYHRAPQRLKRLWRRVPSHHVVELAVTGLRQHRVSLKSTLGALSTGILLTGVLVVAGRFIATGIDLRVGYVQMLVILSAVICATSLPISVGGHGVREAVFVVMFSSLTLDGGSPLASGIKERAVLFSVLFFLMTLVWSVFGGFVYLASSTGRRLEIQPAEDPIRDVANDHHDPAPQPWCVDHRFASFNAANDVPRDQRGIREPDPCP